MEDSESKDVEVDELLVVVVNYWFMFGDLFLLECGGFYK